MPGLGLLNNLFGWGLSEYFPYLVYGLSFVIALLTLFYRSELGILYIAGLLPIYSIVDKTLKLELPLANHIINLLIVAMLLGWLFQKGKKNEGNSIGQSPLLIPIFILVNCSFVSLVISSFSVGEGFLDRLATWKNYMIMPVLYLILYFTLRDRKLKWAFWKH